MKAYRQVLPITAVKQGEEIISAEFTTSMVLINSSHIVSIEPLIRPADQGIYKFYSTPVRRIKTSVGDTFVVEG